MPLPRLRFTVRRLMGVVLLVAIGFPLVHLCQLHERYKNEAKRHDEYRLYLTKQIKDRVRILPGYESDKIPERQRLLAGELADIEQLRKRSEYHSKMKEKYESAALFPWMSVESDPAPPYVRTLSK